MKRDRRVPKAEIHPSNMAMQPLTRSNVVPSLRNPRPQPKFRSTRGSMQVLCASNLALSPSALRQSISKNSHRVATAKRISLLNKLPDTALIDMSILGQEVEYTEGEVVHAAGSPSNGLTILLEGETCTDCYGV